MSSGHKAGLQHYEDFNKSEKIIQDRKHQDAKHMVDKYGMGETVHRDKDGKKSNDNNSNDMDGNGKSKEENKADAQRRLNQGKVQQMKQVAMATEMEILQNSTFARRKDDERLEDVLKNEIRKDDPMAKYAMNTQQKKQNKNNPQQPGQQQVKARPMYKGPQPKANRFGIRPGYRWDGVDRGNCFEDKIIAKKFSANHNKEKAYRWSSQDM